MTLLLALTLLAGVSLGNASQYGFVGDPYDNVGQFACQGRLQARYGTRTWRTMRDHGVAHRTLPCGTRVGICLARTRRCTTAYVVDRGPWGTLNRQREWHVRTRGVPPGEYYRGHLDLLPKTYTAIGLVGVEAVYYWVVDPDPPPSRRNDKVRRVA